jgi:hypothetical protein
MAEEACCKGKKRRLSLYLRFSEQQKKNREFRVSVGAALVDIMDYTTIQADQLVTLASLRERCLLYEGVEEDVIALSSVMAEYKVPCEVENTSYSKK